MITYTRKMRLTEAEFKQVDEVHQFIRKAVDKYADEFRTGNFPNIQIEYVTSMRSTTLAPLYRILFFIDNIDGRQNIAELQVFIEKESEKLGEKEDV